MPPTTFKHRVLDYIRQIPAGKVASYGQIASLAGTPRAARQVGWILGGLGLGTDVPWWRVVNNQGYLSIRGKEFDAKNVQAEKLQEEGIPINENFKLDIAKYRWVVN